MTCAPARIGTVAVGSCDGGAIGDPQDPQKRCAAEISASQAAHRIGIRGAVLFQRFPRLLRIVGDDGDLDQVVDNAGEIDRS